MSSSSIRVTWKPPKKELTYGLIKGYYVGYKVLREGHLDDGLVSGGGGGGSGDIGSLNGSSVSNHNGVSSYTYKTLEAKDRSSNEEAHITGLTRASKYSITVQAFNSKGSGPASEEIVVQTLEKGLSCLLDFFYHHHYHHSKYSYNVIVPNHLFSIYCYHQHPTSTTTLSVRQQSYTGQE